MSGYVPGADRQQTVLFPETLEEYVAADNPVRVIDAFVDRLDLVALGLRRAVPEATGRPGYDPRVLLKLYIYGYLYRIRSSRRLERETHRNVELLWLLGRLQPDHKTIADFRATQAAALRAVFREFTVLCRELELFGAELVAIDGSKFRAVNSKDRSFTPEKLRKLLARIDARTQAYLAELAAADRAEQPPAPRGTPDDADEGATGGGGAAALQAKLDALAIRQQEYQAQAAALEASGARQVTLTDPESRLMKVGSGTAVCYNTQLAVDAKHHLIVAVDVTNEGNDLQQLTPMATAAQTALGGGALAVVADAGYYNGPQVAACAAAGITVTTPAVDSSPRGAASGLFPKSAFQYDAATDCYRCPAGALLPYRFTTEQRGQPHRCYYDFAACAVCPLRAQCTEVSDPAGGRRILRAEAESHLEAMAARLRAAPDLMRQRASLVEHCFGTMKRGHDGGYFLLRGLVKVRGEASLQALAYNLRRVLSVVSVPTLLAVLRPVGGAAAAAEASTA